MTMPLILAIEPNKHQAQQIALLVKQLRAELVAAVSADAALTSLGNRIPDLILTPALLPSKDEAALTEYLRHLGPSASHIHTLAVPILASGRTRARDGGGGLLGRRREKSDAEASVGCDPAVFSEQIKVYLDRAAREREAIAEAVEPVPPDQVTQADEAEETEVFDELVWLPDTIAAASLTAVPDAAPPAEPVIEVVANVQRSPETMVSDAPPPLARVERRKARTESPVTRAWEAELGLPRSVSGSAPLWRVTEEGIDALSADVPVIVAEEPAPVAEAAMPDPILVSAPATPPVKAPKAKKPAPPPLDDWAYFDPVQSPFKALIRRLDEIAGRAAQTR